MMALLAQFLVKTMHSMQHVIQTISNLVLAPYYTLKVMIMPLITYLADTALQWCAICPSCLPMTMSKATLPPAEWPTTTAELTSRPLMAASAAAGRAGTENMLVDELWPNHWVRRLCTSSKMDAVGGLKLVLEH